MRQTYTTIRKILFTIQAITAVSTAWAQHYDNGTWYSLFETTQYSKSTALEGSIHTYNNVFAPSKGEFSFESKLPGNGSASKTNTSSSWSDPNDYGVTSYNITFGGISSPVALNVSSSYSQSKKKIVIWYYTHTYSYTYNYKTVSGSGLDAELTSIDAYYEYVLKNTLRTVYIKDVKVPMAPHIRLKSSSNSNGVTDQTLTAFGDTKWGTTASGYKSVSFRSFLTMPSNGNITITCDKPEIFRLGSADNTEGLTYTVGANTFAHDSRTPVDHASDVANYNFRVYFCPAEVEDYSATITISNGSNNVATVHVSGKGIKRDQTIQDFTTIATKTTDVVDFNAYTTDNTTNAQNNLAVTYESDHPEIATINASTGVVTIIKDGTVKFTATQAGNKWYNSASKDVTWNISKVTPTVTWPTINSGLVYTLGAKVQDNWTGGSAKDDKNNPVAGTFVCTDELQPAKNGIGYTVEFQPTNTKWYNTTSTTLKKDVAKADQYITWTLVENEEYTAGTVMGATATSGLAVSYLSSDESIAEIVDGALKVNQANKTVTITAYQNGDGNWNAASPVEKVIKTCGARPDFAYAEAEGIVYGQLLEEANIINGIAKLGDTEIAGTFAWKEPATLPNAGTRNYNVVFTPSNSDTYASVTFPVSLTVAKADPVLTWKISNLLREGSVYTNFVTSTNNEQALTIQVSNSTLLQVSGNVLRTGEVDNTVNNLTITVSQAASANYNALAAQVWSGSLNPKVNVCLPVVLNASLLHDMVVASQEQYAWCPNTVAEIDTKYHVALSDFDVKYSEEQGISLGTWQDGLTGLSWNKLVNLIKGEGTFEWSPKSIDLSFTGIPDRIQFSTALQTLKYNVLGIWYTATVTADNWKLYQSADGENYTLINGKQGATSFDEALNEDTRYVRIEYLGNFTGFVKNLQISQKKYLTADKSELEFGTNDRPLQEPQTLTVSYSSLGSCALQNGNIAVTTDNPAFYTDVTEITENVGIDQKGEFTVRVRCNDVNKSGHVVFTAYDGTVLEVPVHSTNAKICSAANTVFQTGSEHAPETNTAYKMMETLDFASCFNGTIARFDTLYIYGVTESAANNRQWAGDVSKGYNVPVFAATDGETEGSAYTPCFVYAKSGNEYVYIRTFDAANKSLAIRADGRKLWFSGYRPVAAAAAKPAVAVSGNADIYMSNVELNACGVVLTAQDGTVTVHARGTNNLNVTGEASAIALDTDNQTALVVEDSWTGDAISGKLNLNGAAGKPTIDLGNATNSLTINGTQITLKNGAKMAVAFIREGIEQADGTVRINDGTILGEAELGLPANTTIDGGTFNDGTVRVYTNLTGKGTLPLNSNGDILGRYTMAESELPANYGKAHLTADINAKVHPMLLNENIYIYQTDGSWMTENNWNKNNTPNPEDIVIVRENVTISTDVVVAAMTIEDGGSVTILNGGSLTISDAGYDQFAKPQYGDLTIKGGGHFEPGTTPFIVQNFYMEAAIGDNTYSARSGDVSDAESLVINGDAYFDLVLDQSGHCSYGWYDFTVPFPVDATTGVSRYENGVWRNDLRIEVNYAIMAHYEELRAEGKYGWKKYHGVMNPNQCYTITVDDTAPLYRFHKKAGAALVAGKQLPLQVTGDGEERGWNALGNGSLSIRDLDVEGDTKVQLYDHTDNAYTAYRVDEVKFAVGSAFFIQAPYESSVNLRQTTAPKALRLQERVSRKVNEFTVQLLEADAEKVVDRLYLSAGEEALDEYEVGRDLSKMGTPKEAKIAQMWCNAYGKQLCDVELPLVDNVANFDITLFAPKDGEFSLKVAQMPEDATLYLTYAGAVVWNLSVSEFPLELIKGENSNYGLRIVAKEQTSHEISTGTETVEEGAQNIRKQFVNGVLFIERDGVIYNATGKRVK